MSGVAQTVGANVRRLRRIRGLSLIELGQHARVAKGTLTQLESGRGNPTLRTLQSLALALGVDLALLVSEPAATTPAVAPAVPDPVASPRRSPPRRTPPQVPVRGTRPISRSVPGRGAGRTGGRADRA